MKLLDLTLPTPAENLACDEALLDAAEHGGGSEVLRFWESPEHFVVVGYANKVASEVNVAACEARGVPIYRRCSGGGTVLHGPGCLNYALILKITSNGPLKNISASNRFIMELNREAIEAAGRVTPCAPPTGGQRIALPTLDKIEVCGHTDLALVTDRSSHVTEKKFSGNSQRRRKHHLLFHGTLLLNFDLALIGDVLRMPSKEPCYREGRSHVDFLSNLNVEVDSVKRALACAWSTNDGGVAIPTEQISKLVTEKYGNRDWNFKL